MGAPDDLTLLEAWRGGNTAAGESLFGRHFDALCRFFRNKLPDSVDDLIQRTFLRCVEHSGQFEGRSTFRTYMFAIARNELYAELRSRHRSEQRFDPLECSVQQVCAGAHSVIAKQRERRILLEALRRIPLEHQVVLELFFWEDLTGPQMAEILDAPEGTVRTRIRRARQLLQCELEALMKGGPQLSTTTSDVEAWARALRGQLAR